MENILFWVFLGLCAYYLGVIVYCWITWNIPLLRKLTKNSWQVAIIFIVLLIIGLIIDGKLFYELIDDLQSMGSKVKMF